jgi:hypothetical protein
MTANAEITETTVLNIHNTIAELIGDYTVYVCDDGGGPYLSLNNPEDDEDYRCLSLSEESCSEDLSLYRWRFWNSGKANLWLDSTLGADAEPEAVLAFLAECLAEEGRQLAAMCY